ncbi:hypothetical protein DMA12_18360 [Amycolatopsis balhimycina DSM 5908]|uniref:Uncharacterized protein n=1 Tax=Amycolatopsis balhimycina DSM 5908 TaxID=1081091 RepID=A0A428WLC9_AMYBA|nr:hypothetical protein DMA12_18360 [Amycolatopsis balhimycina DSM 5908]
MIASQQVLMGRSEEPLGTETRRIDNSASNSTSIRRIRAQRSWIRKQELLFEKLKKRSVTGGVEVANVLNLRGALEETVKQSQTSVTQAEEIFEEQIELTIPARTAVDILLHWKQVWQEGLLIVTTSTGETYEVPYREVVGITFDQQNRDH